MLLSNPGLASSCPSVSLNLGFLLCKMARRFHKGIVRWSEMMCWMQLVHSSGGGWQSCSGGTSLPLKGSPKGLSQTSQSIPGISPLPLSPNFPHRSFAHQTSAWHLTYWSLFRSWYVSPPSWDTFKGDVSYSDSASVPMTDGRSFMLTHEDCVFGFLSSHMSSPLVS